MISSDRYGANRRAVILVRAILINTVERTVSETAVSDVWADIRRYFETGQLIRVATLPAGDGVYVTVEAKDSPATFRLGGSAKFGGCGLVLGKRGQFGMIRDAITDAADVELLTVFDPR
jgi:hypothetical protein